MLYWKIILNTVQSSTAYRFYTFITTFQKALHILVHISLWTALYAGTNAVNVNGGASLEQMVTYVIISTAISIFVANSNIIKLTNKVQSGEISISLIRPISLFRSMLFETIGSKFFSTIFEIFPILILGYVFFDFTIPSFTYFILFIFSLVIAFIIFFLITFLIGLCSFWYLRIFHLDFVLNSVISFFSGSWIPLWLFPEGLKQTALLLPFELIYYSPIVIFLEQVSVEEISNSFLKALVWLIILGAANFGVWRIGVKRLVIQGG